MALTRRLSSVSLFQNSIFPPFPLFVFNDFNVLNDFNGFNDFNDFNVLNDFNVVNILFFKLDLSLINPVYLNP
jgi:hypothetical protein